MSATPRKYRQVTLHSFVFVLSMLLTSTAWGASLHPPEKLHVYCELFATVQSVIVPPFTLFPGLGGADKTRFILDDFINRDELLHTTTYLQAQLIIRKLFSPDTVPELQASVNACEFLLRKFHRVASQKDEQGNLAIGEEDIEQLFAPPANRVKERLNLWGIIQRRGKSQRENKVRNVFLKNYIFMRSLFFQNSYCTPEGFEPMPFQRRKFRRTP